MRRSVLGLAVLASLTWAPPAGAAFEPGTRVLLDAHNCYPDHGRWADRLARALSTGTPIAIEQDLVWYVDPATGQGRSLVAHDEPGQPRLGLTGHEPTLKTHFFERIRPLVEQALREGRRETWPIITLNLDFKTEEPEHLAALWRDLEEYRAWLTTGRRGATLDDMQPLTVGPVLVLTGESDRQRVAYHDVLQPGAPLLLFGAAHRNSDRTAGRRTNYHRWSNNPWAAVEAGGQRNAGAWTPEDEARLRHLVETAHQHGLWIRFYTLNGHDATDESGGWSAGYNFGSLAAARERWQAALRAGVDFIASDQYEDLAATLGDARALAATIVLDGTLTRADYEQLLERRFAVPDGIAALEVSLDFSGIAERTVIDLGLRGPAGLRGWSGGGAQTISIGAWQASFGYMPGPIEPGEWAVVLGVPNIRDGRHDRYTVTIRLWRDRRPSAPASMVARRGAGWFVGDLHAHSGHSDGRALTGDGRRVGVPPHRVFDAARAAGLDFVALTDHNTAAHWLDVDRQQPYYPDVLLLHGREMTTYRGHANAIGELRFHDFRLPTADAAGVASVMSGPHDDGAFISLNHPVLPDDERCMGCGWNDFTLPVLSRVHGMEVANGSGPEAMMAWRRWADLLNQGLRLTAVGGSDEHTPDELVDRALGSPATVVFASELSEAAIVHGLKSGRVYVRTRGRQGPTLDFWASEATGDRSRRYEMGSSLAPAGRLQLHLHVQGADGSVTWIRNGEAIGRAAASLTEGPPLSVTVDAARGDWFSVIVNGADGPLAFTNAIFVEP